MKFFALATLLAACVAAVDVGLVAEPRTSRRTTRSVRAANNARSLVPDSAPEGYTVSISEPTVHRSLGGLQQLPADLASGLSRRQAGGGADFYECYNVKPNPVEKDCQVIVDQLHITKQDLMVAERGCIVLQYKTCKAFFCALCEDMGINTDFIASYLDTAQALCVSDGKDGVLVGQSRPQWDLGFVHTTEGLPSFDVC